MTVSAGVSLSAFVAESESDPGPGSIGFWVVVALAVALFFLYRSMRKQVRRIDFDPAGMTDEERMNAHGDDEPRAASAPDEANHEASESRDRPAG